MDHFLKKEIISAQRSINLRIGRHIATAERLHLTDIVKLPEAPNNALYLLLLHWSIASVTRFGEILLIFDK